MSEDLRGAGVGPESAWDPEAELEETDGEEVVCTRLTKCAVKGHSHQD